MAFRILPAVLAAVTIATAAPASAGIWSSITSFLSGPFTSRAPDHPSLKNYSKQPDTTIIRTRDRRGNVVYLRVPYTDPRAPSTGWNNYGDPFAMPRDRSAMPPR